MGDALVLRGELEGHTGWVTSLATTETDPHVLVSGSRDKSVILWRLQTDGDSLGAPARRLTGHRHFISDVTFDNKAEFCLSSSWDGSMRLWDLSNGDTTRQYHGHSKDVLSFGLSPDNRMIVSGGRDKSVRVFNAVGECKLTIPDAHGDWVSCVRFSPSDENPLFLTAGWDKVVKVWSTKDFKLKHELAGHTGYVSAVTVSPDGSLCASGGKDGIAMLWDLNEGKRLYVLNADAPIHALCFSPNRYWLCAATAKAIVIWDLESKAIVATLSPEWEKGGRKALTHFPTSLVWSADGSTLYSGYTDCKIRVWAVSSAA